MKNSILLKLAILICFYLNLSKSDAQIIWQSTGNDPIPAVRIGAIMLGAGNAPIGGKLNIWNSNAHSHLNISGTGPSLKFSNGYTANAPEVYLGLATATNQIFGGTVTNDFSLVNSTSTGSLTFATNNIERFKILPNGNFGIGISVPTTKLDVNGTIKATGLLFPTGASLNKVLVSDASGNATWQLLAATNVNAWQAGGNAAGAADFIGTSNTNPLIFKTNALESMRITSAGNVGIGDNATVNKLSIVGTDANDKNFIKLNNMSATAISCVGIRLGAGATSALPSLTYTAPSYTSIVGWADVLALSNNGAGGVALSAPSANGQIRMFTNIDASNNPVERMIIKNNGNIGIGVSNPLAKLTVNGNVSIGDNYVPSGYMLAINGKVIATEVAVKLRSNWGDFCFAPEFELMPLSEVEAFVKKYRHLPGVLSAVEIEKNGLELGEMENILMQKVEQLTLYSIEQDKTITLQKQKDLEQQSKIDQLIKLVEAQNLRIEKLEIK